ncbi:MAG: hypothetical protein WCC82_09600, partial [Nitrososphaeraceae archaeon]
VLVDRIITIANLTSCNIRISSQLNHQNLSHLYGYWIIQNKTDQDQDIKPYKVTLWLLLLLISVFTALSVDYFLENLPIVNLSILMILVILVLIAWSYGS